MVILNDNNENMNGYVMSSVDEYFAILDREAQKRSKMVAKSLTKYLKSAQTSTKYEELKATSTG